jgi:hypothetical protein
MNNSTKENVRKKKKRKNKNQNQTQPHKTKPFCMYSSTLQINTLSYFANFKLKLGELALRAALPPNPCTKSKI